MKLEYEKAKKIFDMYNGNKFQMQREGDLKEYHSYNIPKEIEESWGKECVDKLKAEILSAKTIAEKLELITAYVEASKRLYDNSIISYIDNFVQETSDMDSYTIIRLIELKLNELISSSENRDLAIKDCINSLRNLEKDELIVDKSYYIDGELPDYLLNDKLKLRIKNLINYWGCQI